MAFRYPQADAPPDPSIADVFSWIEEVRTARDRVVDMLGINR
ncbi:hypothetical protein C882_3417 [Caenispirillum salinarum AK4]|uniref:Uncharacterized protein n=1 Tax=Caenispirillum salinarum AK4 TaxID=1238182 RepID=K9H292_9PROT|nr:hypothetical protein C882_3417 [Caenispirillum salinarum AK4]